MRGEREQCRRKRREQESCILLEMGHFLCVTPLTDGRTDGLRPDPSPRSARPSVVRYRVSLRSLSLSSRRTKHRGRGSGRRTKPTSLNPLTQSVLYFKARLSPLLTPAESPCTFIGGGCGIRTGMVCGKECRTAWRGGRGRGRGLKETAWGKPPSTARLLTLPSLTIHPPTLLPQSGTHTHLLKHTRGAGRRPDPLSCRFLPPEGSGAGRERRPDKNDLGHFPPPFFARPAFAARA